MTYKELKEKLNKLTEYQLNQEVKVMQEDDLIKGVASIEVSNEDYIYEKEYPSFGCFPKSELNPKDDEDDYCVCMGSGTVFIYVE